MGKIDISKAPITKGSRYPAPFDAPCNPRVVHRLGDAVSLTQFGVNLVELPPGAWSSQRHWHSHEDELVYVVEGTVVMVTDAGDEPMGPGDCAGFKGGVRDGHCFQNRSSMTVKLVIGSRNDEDHGEYPDIDMQFLSGRYTSKARFAKKDGTLY